MSYMRTGESPDKAKEHIEEQLYHMHQVKSFRGVCLKKCSNRGALCETCLRFSNFKQERIKD